MKKIRLAIVISHPIQYATPLYAYLNEDPDLDITAIYCTDYSLRGAKDPGFGQTVKWDVDLLTGYRSVFLGERAKKRSISGFWSLVCPELVQELSPDKYDAVMVHGQQFAAYVLAFVIAKCRGIPVLTRGETHSGLKRAPWRRTVRDAVLSKQFKFIDGFLAIGTMNRDYYRSLGVGEDRIFHVPYSVDNDRFVTATTVTAAQRSDYRRELGVTDDRPILLYASKFTTRKHPDDVLRAAATLREQGHKLHVVMAGAGELDGQLRELSSRLTLTNVHFTGFVNQSKLPQVFAASDIFVLPSENEPWGLIVNEAMCAGLPVVVGSGVGCVPDLVQNGVNGATCIAGSAESLTNALLPLVADDSLRRRMGEQSRTIISNWGYQQCKRGIRAAVSKYGQPS